MKIQILPLAMLASVLVFWGGGCSDSDKMAIAAENTRLEAEMKRLLADAARDKEKAIAEIKAENERLRKEVDAASNDPAKLEAMQADYERRLEELEAEFDAYKERYRASVRQKAKGQAIADMNYRGTSYKGITIRSIDDLGISVAHADGVARLEFTHLAVELQDKYAYDPIRAAVAKQGEVLGREQYQAKLEETKAGIKQAEVDSMKRVKAESKEKARLDLTHEIINARAKLKTLTSKLYRTSSTSASYSVLREQKNEMEAWIDSAEVRLSSLGGRVSDTY